MRRIFLIIVFCMVMMPAFAEDLERVNNIGKSILEKSKLPTEITFLVSEEDHVNAYANIKNEICVYKGLLNVAKTDDELAGVIAHEIGHIVNQHAKKRTIIYVVLSPISNLISKIKTLWIQKVAAGAQSLAFMKISRNDEYEADLTAADLMIKAGYNPKGMISILDKISSNHLDLISTHPSKGKRILYFYDYVSYNYPSYLEPRDMTPEELAEYNKIQEKLKEERAKRFERLRIR